MKDPLVAWIEEDPMNARLFLEYDSQTSLCSNLIFRVRLLLGV